MSHDTATVTSLAPDAPCFFSRCLDTVYITEILQNAVGCNNFYPQGQYRTSDEGDRRVSKKRELETPLRGIIIMMVSYL